MVLRAKGHQEGRENSEGEGIEVCVFRRFSDRESKLVSRKSTPRRAGREKRQEGR